MIRAILLAMLVAAPAQAAPNIESPKMLPVVIDGAFTNLPEAFYLLVNGARRDCEAVSVKSTGSIQARCDIEDLQDGVYTVVLVAVKTSNGLETQSAPMRLTVSLRYGARTYQGARIYNTSYTLVPMP
jgi:hypothetical protein